MSKLPIVLSVELWVSRDHTALVAVWPAHLPNLALSVSHALDETHAYLLNLVFHTLSNRWPGA